MRLDTGAKCISTTIMGSPLRMGNLVPMDSPSRMDSMATRIAVMVTQARSMGWGEHWLQALAAWWVD
jgi:hypothetical protein